MTLVIQHLRAILLILFILLFSFAWGQSTALNERDSVKTVEIGSATTAQASDGEMDNTAVRQRRHVITFQASRLFSRNYPSATLTYQQVFKHWGVTASLGLPINQIEVFKENSGDFSGIDGRLGIRAYPLNDPEFKLYFALDGLYYNNPVEAEGYLREEGKTTFRATNLKLNRRREAGLLSFGFVWLSPVGIALDMSGGLLRGRQGIFAQNDQLFLSNDRNNFFEGIVVPPSRWDPYYSIQLGLGLGYTF